MVQYQDLSESQSSSVMRDIQARYGAQAGMTGSASPPHFISLPASPGANVVIDSINSTAGSHSYYELLKELEAKAAEWQRAEEERWEKLEMEMGVERDIVFKEPKRPSRIITAKVRNMGRAPVPKHLFDDWEA